MPVKLKKLKGGKVRVSTPSGPKSYATTLENALKQRNLLNALDHDPDFKKRKKQGGNISTMFFLVTKAFLIAGGLMSEGANIPLLFKKKLRNK